MIQKYFFLPFFAFICCILASCEDETSKIGGALTQDDISISIDTLTFNLNAKAVEVSSYDSKSGTLLLGNIQTPEYGNLECSFVTSFLCSPALEVPDSLSSPERVDSCKLKLFAYREGITGDSLAPQQLSVFRLLKKLPSNITNNFNPEGYYSPSDLFAYKNYTLSNVDKSDSIFIMAQYVPVTVDFPVEFGKEVFEKYESDPSIFQWPQTFANFFPGLYVKSTFGHGNIANLFASYITIYYHHKEVEKTVVNSDTIKTLINVRDSVVPFTISPEVISSNNIKYTVSDRIKELNHNNEIVLTTPGGYYASFNFPADDLISIYRDKTSHLATVNDLILKIPAEKVTNNYGIGVADNLLLVLTSEMDDFFNKNKIPDNKTSFTGAYNSKTGLYTFTSLREYILNLIKKGSISEEDINFTLIPVEITTETESNSYYGTSTSYVTKVVPYTLKPTMTRLKTEEANIIFSFSSQMIE